MPNSYQRRKARKIAAVLMLAAVNSDTPIANLPLLASRMTESQWRTVSFEAGVAVADRPARVFTIALLCEVSA